MRVSCASWVLARLACMLHLLGLLITCGRLSAMGVARRSTAEPWQAQGRTLCCMLRLVLERHQNSADHLVECGFLCLSTMEKVHALVWAVTFATYRCCCWFCRLNCVGVEHAVPC